MVRNALLLWNSSVRISRITSNCKVNIFFYCKIHLFNILCLSLSRSHEQRMCDLWGTNILWLSFTSILIRRDKKNPFVKPSKLICHFCYCFSSFWTYPFVWVNSILLGQFLEGNFTYYSCSAVSMEIFHIYKVLLLACAVESLLTPS